MFTFGGSYVWKDVHAANVCCWKVKSDPDLQPERQGRVFPSSRYSMSIIVLLVRRRHANQLLQGYLVANQVLFSDDLLEEECSRFVNHQPPT